MDDGPYWVILLMYGSHDMRHTGFRKLTVVNGTPGFWGVTLIVEHGDTKFHRFQEGVLLPCSRTTQGDI